MEISRITNNRYNVWFFFVALYLIIDYGRPQDILPIGFVKPSMLCIIFLMFYLIRSGNLFYYSSKQIRMIWYFIILLALHVPFAVNHRFAYGTTQIMFLYMPFIISVIFCVNSINRLKKLMMVCIGLMIYVALYSITHGGLGSGNYFQDENDVSLYINMWLPFCYFLLLSEEKISHKLFYAVGLIVGLIAIVISFSRGGFIGLIALGFIAWLSGSRKILAIFVILFSAGIVYFAGGSAYMKEMSTITDGEDNTVKERILSWESAWDMFLDNPLGVGGNNFQVRFPEYQGDRFKRGMYGRVAHSLWFTLISELGTLGIIIYFMLIYYNIKDIFFLKRQRILNENAKYIHAMSLSFLASFAGYFASATFLSVLYYPHYWYLTSVIIATTGIARSLQSEQNYTGQQDLMVSA